MNKFIGGMAVLIMFAIGVVLLSMYITESNELETVFTDTMSDIIEKNHNNMYSLGHVIRKNNNKNITGCVHMQDNKTSTQRQFKFIKYNSTGNIEIKEISCNLTL